MAKVNENYVARKSERAIEMLVKAALKKLSLKAEILKFAHNEDESNMETKWDIHLKSEEDALKLAGLLKIPYVETLDYGELEGDYVIILSLCWDAQEAYKQLDKERKLVNKIEGFLKTTITEGVEDVEILKGPYHWGLVETFNY